MVGSTPHVGEENITDNVKITDGDTGLGSKSLNLHLTVFTISAQDKEHKLEYEHVFIKSHSDFIAFNCLFNAILEEGVNKFLDIFKSFYIF
jgi:hypothetical protein